MVDWLNLLFNAAWIAGIAVLLALLSAANWSARARGMRLRDLLALPRQQAIIALSGLLFSIGMFGTTHLEWERVVWALAILALAVSLVQSVRKPNMRNNMHDAP